MINKSFLIIFLSFFCLNVAADNVGYLSHKQIVPESFLPQLFSKSGTAFKNIIKAPVLFSKRRPFLFWGACLLTGVAGCLSIRCLAHHFLNGNNEEKFGNKGDSTIKNNKKLIDSPENLNDLDKKNLLSKDSEKNEDESLSGSGSFEIPLPPPPFKNDLKIVSPVKLLESIEVKCSVLGSLKTCLEELIQKNNQGVLAIDSLLTATELGNFVQKIDTLGKNLAPNRLKQLKEWLLNSEVSKKWFIQEYNQGWKSFQDVILLLNPSFEKNDEHGLKDDLKKKNIPNGFKMPSIDPLKKGTGKFKLASSKVSLLALLKKVDQNKASAEHKKLQEQFLKKFEQTALSDITLNVIKGELEQIRTSSDFIKQAILQDQWNNQVDEYAQGLMAGLKNMLENHQEDLKKKHQEEKMVEEKNEIEKNKSPFLKELEDCGLEPREKDPLEKSMQLPIMAGIWKNFKEDFLKKSIICENSEAWVLVAINLQSAIKDALSKTKTLGIAESLKLKALNKSKDEKVLVDDDIKKCVGHLIYLRLKNK